MELRMAQDSNERHSKLSDHVMIKGRLKTPFNHSLGGLLKLTSWHINRMPEYVWLGLILQAYGREETFKRVFPILQTITSIDDDISFPMLSRILSLSEEKQIRIYEEICKNIEANILCPLTLIIDYVSNPLFYRYFLDPTMQVGEKLDRIRVVARKIIPHQSNDATDIRFLALSIMLLKGRIRFNVELQDSIEAFHNYAQTKHEDDRMRMYRPLIRTLEGAVEADYNSTFSKTFWSELGDMDLCNLYFIPFEEVPMDKNFYDKTKEVIDILISSNKHVLLEDDRFITILGLVCYSIKIYGEVLEKNLGNSILGRHANRTIIEVYLILKSLILKENEEDTIWGKYQAYGLSKYKLQLLKSREYRYADSHFVEPVIEAIINEPGNEDFLDVDLRYFDDTNIREKSESVGEKLLYGISYDYDTSYVHGFWGAIRESSMLMCDNPLHKFHYVPDISNGQNLPDVSIEITKNLKKIIDLLNQSYRLPEQYFKEFIDEGNSDAQ